MNQLGKPLKRDYATTCRDKIKYDRVMVEVHMDQALPDQLSFMDEHGEMVGVPVHYEWRPAVCTRCKLVGHVEADCRQTKTKRVWVQKQQVSTLPVPAFEVEPVVDQEGLQRALRPIRVRTSSVQPTQVDNPFQLLLAQQDGDGIVEHVAGAGHIGDSVGRGDLLSLMDRILCWNVRGINSTQKQNEVRKFVQRHDVGLVGLLEHKVKLAKLGKLYQNIFMNWCFTSNASFHNGGRIVVAWKLNSFTVNIVAVTSQLIHCHVNPVSGMTSFFCTFFYAFNDSSQRKELWKTLMDVNTRDPWLLGGDFNCVMGVKERIGDPVRHAEILDINACMHGCSMEDIKSVGSLYTWNNKQYGAARVFSKLDRVLSNPAWQSAYCSAEACFLTEGEFDNSPGLITVYPRHTGGRKPFRYFTMWKSSPDFAGIVQHQWNQQVHGS
ncbi:uncharacterized protein [Spinacia oleracea]|uniref:Endonuclease/exonuclease/phosphatase domain-containing protein n=1 Tax=Spinacia oleracea TaxID=3562 RepID=A0ABM3QX05_SPIOL|nr:uncharacterized protein LOC110785929 [Spinacia oleracea]